MQVFRTKYGIVSHRATVDGKPVAYTALRSTYRHEADSILGFQMLNDPTYVEAARVFAARILEEGGAETPARIAWAWEQALQRPPRDGDTRELVALLDKLRSHYGQDREAAESLLKVGLAPRPEGVDPGELAAWTNVARVILNLHETITRN